MGVQAVVPEAAVEALDERILHRFASRSLNQLNTMLAGPLIERLAGKFQAMVGSNGLGTRWVDRAFVHPLPCHANETGRGDNLHHFPSALVGIPILLE